MARSRISFWLTNRVVWGLAVLFVTVWFWEFHWKPQYRPFYADGMTHYHHKDYQGALSRLTAAYDIAPNAVDVIMMMGWANFKLNRFEEARFYFNRAIRIDPRLEEAQMGTAFVAMETGRGQVDSATLKKYLGERIKDPNVGILMAEALLREGRNFEAAAIYKKLANDKDYGTAATEALQGIFGLQGFSDSAPDVLAPIQKPAELQVRFRAAEGAMWRRGNHGPADWDKFYVNGVNLGPGAPGYFPGAPPQNGATYASWLTSASAMNANVIRAYTLLPPAFYRAFAHRAKAGAKELTLYQQIWVGDAPNNDLFDEKFVAESKNEIRYVVDALHGHGDVPQKHARGSGVYDQDISKYVGAILLGREVEPSVAIQTNLINAGKTSYQGKYVSVSNANATEVWFAQMLDFLVTYESDTYNWQHPVAIVNWPPMDPLYHPTEAPNLEEVKFRIRHGEQLALPKGIEDDNDTVSIDEAKYRISPELAAGFFASYHIYPYYPDFLLFDPRYQAARDSHGLNPMYGYMKELRAHIPYPLVVTEFGLPNSLGISHFHPLGWHHGGHSEEEQAELMARLARSIRESGAAGGVVFELLDEWYKHNWLTVDFEDPLERANLWLNELDPEKRYGMIGFRPSQWKLFSASADDQSWERAQTLYSATNASAESKELIKSVQAAADEAFLYLRIKVDCLDCARAGAKTKENKLAYAVALNTIPKAAGVQRLPFGNTKIEPGANFLLYLGEPTSSRLLIARNYNPYQLLPRPGVPHETELGYKREFTPVAEEQGEFEELVVETNRRRYGRDGTAFPGQRYSRSVLRYGAESPDNSLTEWFKDTKRNAILVRIPWGKLLLTDPSSLRAFYGFDAALHARTRATQGIEATVFALAPNGGGNPNRVDLSAMTVVASLPEAVNGTIAAPARITWKGWETVKPEQYFKKAYYAMQEEYGAAPVAQGLVRRSDRNRAGSHTGARAAGQR